MQQYRSISIIFSCIFLMLPLQISKAMDAEKIPLDVSFSYALDTAQSSPRVVIEMVLTIDDDYYTYAHNETDGLPTTVVLQDTSGRILSGEICYPQGEFREDILNDNKVTQVYTGTFPIFIQLGKDTLPSDAEIHISLLLCSSKHCIPLNRQFPIVLPSSIPNIEDTSWENTYLLYSDTGLKSVSSSTSEKQGTSENESLWKLQPQYFQAGLEPTKIEIALLFGFLAGLILNVMPCVLPVLTLKFSFILSHLGYNGEKCFRYVREQNLLFAAGILSWFFILALGVEWLDLAWGGFFQSVPVVYALMLIVFILALSLFDFFTLPVIDFKVETTSYPRIQAYFTGVMTTLLATPCSGPLLGGVLGWAVLQPLYTIFIVFFATGLGMALPYIIFAFKPQAIRFLPKPGAWCGTVERLVGFFLLGTTIYLLSILPNDMLYSALITLLITAFAVWLWGIWGGVYASTLKKIATGILVLCIISFSVWWSFQPAVVVDWSTYSEEAFKKDLGTTPILLEFTADWCPTCKLLEKTVLTSDFLEELVDEYHIKLIRVDLTHKNPESETLLRALGSVSIPVTAIFSTDNVNEPLVLRDLYTSEQLEKALQKALGNK